MLLAILITALILSATGVMAYDQIRLGGMTPFKWGIWVMLTGVLLLVTWIK